VALGDVWATGPVALEERDDELVVGYATEADASAAALGLGERWSVTVEEEPDPASWRDAWRPFAEPITVGAVTVVPSWLPVPAVVAEVVVVIDPGEAFGSGSHPTTRMALGALQDVVRPGDRVLDLGCGSGVLAVVAARLGAGEVTGVDIDPEALVATRANAAANDVALAVAGTTDGTYDLVVANISAGTLVQLAPDTVTRAPRLLLTGILVERVEEVLAAHPGFEVVSQATEDGWVLLHLASADADSPRRA
jgi:ribosomal protein L11 methyltransferase